MIQIIFFGRIHVEFEYTKSDRSVAWAEVGFKVLWGIVFGLGISDWSLGFCMLFLGSPSTFGESWEHGPSGIVAWNFI